MSAAATVLGLVAVGCASEPLRGHASSSSSVVSSSVVSSAVAGTAATLTGDHWSQLPAAPITHRTDAVVAWTGTHLLVWGGASDYRNDTLYADGASYDPITKQWTTLPAAPLSARTQVGWVWTGSSLVVFGGYGNVGSSGTAEPLTDGAAYSPSTNSWRKLPAGPLSPRFNPQLLWTGHEILVIGGDPPNESADGAGYAAGEAAYDPSRNRWTRLPAMPMTPGHDVRHLRAMVTDRGIYVGQLWQHITTDGDTTTLDAGTDFVVYDPAQRTWAKRDVSAATLDDEPSGLDGVTVAGDELLVLPGQGWHTDESTVPAGFGGHGYRLDLATNTWTAMSAGPIDTASPVGVWTGSALLEYSGTIESSIDGGPTTGPGESAVWDPTSDTWTALPTAPNAQLGDNVVWAGDRLLEWGLNGLSFGP